MSQWEEIKLKQKIVCWREGRVGTLNFRIKEDFDKKVNAIEIKYKKLEVEQTTRIEPATQRMKFPIFSSHTLWSM